MPVKETQKEDKDGFSSGMTYSWNLSRILKGGGGGAEEEFKANEEEILADFEEEASIVSASQLKEWANELTRGRSFSEDERTRG